MLGDCLIGGLAAAELAADCRGKIERGDGKVAVDGGRALVRLAMDDVTGEIRAVGRAFLEQGTAEIRVSIDEHSGDLEMFKTAERANIVIEDRARQSLLPRIPPLIAS